MLGRDYSSYVVAIQNVEHVYTSDSWLGVNLALADSSWRIPMAVGPNTVLGTWTFVEVSIWNLERSWGKGVSHLSPMVIGKASHSESSSKQWSSMAYATPSCSSSVLRDCEVVSAEGEILVGVHHWFSIIRTAVPVGKLRLLHSVYRLQYRFATVLSSTVQDSSTFQTIISPSVFIDQFIAPGLSKIHMEVRQDRHQPYRLVRWVPCKIWYLQHEYWSLIRRGFQLNYTAVTRGTRTLTDLLIHCVCVKTGSLSSRWPTVDIFGPAVNVRH